LDRVWSNFVTPTRFGFNPLQIDAIEDFVSMDSSLKGGYFFLYDPKSEQVLKLHLDKVHRERVSKMGNDLYFACADFEVDSLEDGCFACAGMEVSNFDQDIVGHQFALMWVSRDSRRIRRWKDELTDGAFEADGEQVLGFNGELHWELAQHFFAEAIHDHRDRVFFVHPALAAKEELLVADF
jgi:hypothetical protein